MMRTLPQLIISLLVGASLLCACEDEKKEVIHAKTNPETTPTMITTDVTTLISDSGITRFKITTPLWNVFDEAADPRWTFPSGLHLEKFDPAFKPEATIDCDSATFFKDRQLWRLDGYVNIRNTLGEKFLTNQLFWNQREQKIYSDSFIHIEKQGRVIEGYGFESNEQMTIYNVLRVAAIFPASEFKPDSARIAARNDTTAVADGTPLPPPPAESQASRPTPPSTPESRLDQSRNRIKLGDKARSADIDKSALKTQRSRPTRPGQK